MLCFLLAFLLLSSAVSGQFVQTDEAPGYLEAWGGSAGSGDGQFNRPGDVSVGPSGDIFVVDRNNHRIQRFDSAGNFITTWGSAGGADGQFSFPLGVAVDSSGNVYVADSGNARIQKFDSSGNFITKWGSSGSGNGQLNNPQGVAADDFGNVYVADTYNHRIQKFDSEGSFLTKWGSFGSADGQFYYPRGVATGVHGSVVVVSNHLVQKFDPYGVFLTGWGSYGSAAGQFDSPNGVAVDAAGNVYVSDDSDRLQEFDSAGNSLSSWGSSGGGNGQFNFPDGVDVDAFGNVYVADYLNHRIQKFAPVREILVQGEDVRLNVSRVSLDPANRIAVELKNNGSSFFKFTNTFNGQQWTLNPLGNSFTFDNLNFPGQEFRLYNTGRLVITPSSLGAPSFDLKTSGDLAIAGSMTANDYLYTSDRNQKTGFQEVDVADILEGVRRLPITIWRFKNDSTLHMGPMGQDFHALFDVGTDERHLSPTDTAGVALAALRGLNERLEKKEGELLAVRARNARQQEEIDSLKAALARIRSVLDDR